ncbi:MAG TPA: hypothetical protein VK588_14105 [Chitinophagaceae bacterium]|nr:hypothetical protein [Chitinophagaceae bacterium]
MKLFVAIILTALISFVGGFYLPWWSIAIAAFISQLLIPMRSGKAFLAGFLGVFILWGFLAWWIDMKNEHVLSQKVAQIFPLGGSSFAIILVTAFIGGLVGGLAALTGSFLRSKR